MRAVTTLAALTTLATLAAALRVKAALKMQYRDGEREQGNRNCSSGALWRRRFLVEKNVFPAYRQFSGQEAVTLCTHGHFHYFENLKPLLRRWEGPVSLAVHAPGDDRQRALASIRWARECLRYLHVAERVSFHLFCERDHLPPRLQSSQAALQGSTPNCSALAPWRKVGIADTYRGQHHLPYPINTARNVAREAATTHWVLVSEIELYPSPRLNSAFLKMVRAEPKLSLPHPRKIFVLPTFEVEAKSAAPRSKGQLVKMMMRGKARLFHETQCPQCHQFPNMKKWLRMQVRDGLHVFNVTKRTGRFAHWEATFIGTQAEPAYDERLSWEGGKDRRVQAYALCALKYEYHVLDNAFLVHKPGMATTEIGGQFFRVRFIRRTEEIIHSDILPELRTLYGTNTKCVI